MPGWMAAHSDSMLAMRVSLFGCQLDLQAGYFAADGVVDDDCATLFLHRHNRVRGAGGNDCCGAGAKAALFIAEREVQLSLDDVPNLFVRVRVRVQGSAGVDFVISEGHVVGVEKTTAPTLFRLQLRKRARIDESHSHSSSWQLCMRGRCGANSNRVVCFQTCRVTTVQTRTEVTCSASSPAMPRSSSNQLSYECTMG